MMLLQSQGFLEYMEAILLDERSSLNNTYILNFLFNFLPKVKSLTFFVLRLVQTRVIRCVKRKDRESFI